MLAGANPRSTLTSHTVTMFPDLFVGFSYRQFFGELFGDTFKQSDSGLLGGKQNELHISVPSK